MKTTIVLIMAVASACSKKDAPANTEAAEAAPHVLATVDEVESAYAVGRSEGDSRFGDRTLELTGIVTDVSSDYDNRVHVWIGPEPVAKHNDQEIPDPGIDAPMGPGGATERTLAARAMALVKGSHATLVCKAGSGRSREVLGQIVWSPTLYNCSL